MDRMEILEEVKHTPNALALIEAFKRIPDEVEAEVVGLSEEALRFRPADREWSAKEVVGHLRDIAELWDRRLYMVYSQNDPALPGIEEEEMVREADYQSAPDVRAIISTMRDYRGRSVRLLNHAPDWSRTGQHPRNGRRSLRQLVEMAIAHERMHLEQIRSLKAARSG